MKDIFNFFENFNINTAGFVIVGAFVATWALALLYWRVGNVEKKWDARMLRWDRQEIVVDPEPAQSGWDTAIRADA